MCRLEHVYSSRVVLQPEVVIPEYCHELSFLPLKKKKKKTFIL